MTIAEQISQQYNNDGMNWEDENDIDLTDTCEKMCIYVDKNVKWFRDDEQGTFERVYYFSDNSYLAMTENTWDITNKNNETHDRCKIQ